jgi:hypothetical protein
MASAVDWQAVLLDLLNTTRVVSCVRIERPRMSMPSGRCVTTCNASSERKPTPQCCVAISPMCTKFPK